MMRRRRRHTTPRPTEAKNPTATASLERAARLKNALRWNDGEETEFQRNDKAETRVSSHSSVRGTGEWRRAATEDS